MNAQGKAKAQLIEELMQLRRRVAELEMIDSARRQVEEELANMTDLIRGVSDGIVVMDMESNIMSWNDAAENLFGWKAGEAIGKKAEDLLRTEFPRGSWDEARKALLENGYWKGEVINWRKDGAPVNNMALASLVKSPGGEPTRLITVDIDITEHKQAEAALKESEAKLRSLFRVAPTGIGVVSFDRVILQVNDRICEMLGYAEEELVGKSARIVYPTDAGFEYIGKENSKQIERTGTGEVETQWLRKDGGIIDVLLRSIPIDPEDRMAGVIFTALDVTEVKRISSRMEKLNHLFLNLGADWMDNMELITGAARDILECSYAAFYLLTRGKLTSLSTAPGEEGFTVTTEFAGHICYELIAGDMREPIALPDLYETGYQATDPLVAKHGFRSYLGYPVIIEGKTVGCLALFDQRVREFSAEDREIAGMLAQALSVEQERLDREEDLKDFIDIASHEIRHPITIIKGYALSLREFWDELDEGKREELLGAIDQATERLNRLAMELLDVSRIERGYFPISKAEMELGNFLESAVSGMKDEGLSNRFNLSLPRDAGTIRADPDRMAALLFILLDNASRYSPPGSEIDVEAEKDEAGLVISIMDRGIGVPDNDRERIFGRFYQVEDALHHSLPGMGIGLFIAREIVEAHGGNIWCEPREGGGSIFRFTLP